MRATEPPRGLVLLSPLAGWSTPLDEVPDPVFAGRMLGDGLAVDPTGATLHAPCDGEIIALPESKHAVTLRSDGGAEILMHVGVDTVGLGGAGFQVHVQQGRRVATGERLITFDLDLIARRARSLLTPILVLEGCGFTVVRRVENREIAVGDVLMEIAPASEAGERVHQEIAAGEVRHVRVALEHGIHARPAAQIVNALKGLAAQASLVAQGRSANARSIVALMKLGVRKGDEVEVHAAGEDAASAITAVATLLAARSVPPTEVSKPTPVTPQAATDTADVRAGAALPGVIASRGLAVGHAVRLAVREIEVTPVGAGVAHETAQLERARAQVRARLEAARASASGTAREIVEAHLELLDDPELTEKALALIVAGSSAGHSWRQAIRGGIEALRSLGDPRMAERVDDLLDLERQVLLSLSGNAGAAAQELPPDSILIAEELLPSQLVALDASRLAGIGLAAGGATSHVSILAAAMGVPALVALGPAVRRIGEGTPLLLDADAGLLHVDPGADRLNATRRQLERRAARSAAEREAAQQDCYTADGLRIEVFANIGSLAEAQAAARNGAEGCGLLRTEFLFLERETPPSEAEQQAEYQQLAAALAGKPLTVRTLDIGGDKPIPYLPLPAEENPALGLRGVRTSLWRPDLLRQQLRAILGVRPYGQCRILLPMITDVAEIRSVRAMVEEARAGIGRHEPIELGVMIETPASALLAESIAVEADFFSIGTNDLTQYTLAMDRGHPELAARLDALHPAVLRLIAHTAEAAQSRKRMVAVCGGLASDPVAAPILIGLGVRELSAVPSVIPRLKALIRKLTLADCTGIARQALAQSSAEAARALAVRLAAPESEPV
ncbi:MAG TPA: phosphoenolpyruvate--protein phosphotransferase [Steroidobacteraceae bacterium]|jgi:phosphocarrier protein FPr/phosphocarrier protein|nr:phosphoenolpyruvate--protein phosphotransferase [Steroidobacteraceae bacterium]